MTVSLFTFWKFSKTNNIFDSIFFLCLVLKKIVARCPQLCELDLSDCTSLGSQTIDIVAQLDHLEYLSLSRCYNINVSAYL